MSYDDEAFMMMESESSDSQSFHHEVHEHDEEEIVESKSSLEPDLTPATVEDSDEMLMEYLLNGCVLSSAACKTCNTPLIRSIDETKYAEKDNEGRQKAGQPVPGIPFCVACQACIVTSREELEIMWNGNYKHLMGKDKAVILDFDDEKVKPVFASSSAADETEPAVEEDDEVHEPVSTITFERADGVLIIAKDDTGATQEVDPIQDGVVDEVDANPEDKESNSVELAPKEEEEEEIDFEMIEYKKRRQIATKVLGAKMIQGYSLQDSQCEKCKMPLMETPDAPVLECVVCPVLIKKIKKKMAEKNAVAEKKRREEELHRKELEQKETHEKMMSDARKQQLQSQLDAEKEQLREINSIREMAVNIDIEEKQIIEEIRLAREARAREEARLIEEEKRRKLREADAERDRLIEELRVAKEQRKADMERQRKQKLEAEEKLLKAKERELEREDERKRLIEELRIAKEQKNKECQRRIDEAKAAAQKQRESEKLLELKEKEHQQTMTEFKKAQTMIVEQTKKREEDLARAERRAKESEQQLENWRKMADTEKETAERMREEAEEKLLDAEEALVEAEEIALEASDARNGGYGDRARLIDMYRKAEELRMTAEADEKAAKQQLAEADRRLENCERMQRITENRLAKDAEAAQRKLKATKTKLDTEVRQGKQKLQDAENEMLQARFGEMIDVSAAGEDWEARRLLGKKVLAKQVMNGWTVMPQYCAGRMCNFTPLISKGGAVKCVVCEGSGSGRDGFYDEINSQAMLDDTMSFVSKRNRFSRISSANKGGSHVPTTKHSAANREVGRRILDGWQLLDSPCPTCQMPLMCEAYGTPEVCVFCDPDETMEYGDDDDVADDISVSSRQSITLEIPEGFDPSDPNAMADLVSRATRSVSGMSRGRSAAPRNKIPSMIGGRQRSMSRSRSRKAAPLPPGNRMRSQSPRPTPESRNALPSMRRNRVSPRTSQPVYISTEDYDEDDASQLSDDVSVAKSVASHTLDAILHKIESCKSQLNKSGSDDASVAQRSQAASLIEKLAAAAVAVKGLEASAE